LQNTVLKFDKVSYSYPNGKNALKNISFSVSRGEKIAVIGENGAGKSTLLFHINGIFKSEGIVETAGLEVCKKNLIEIRKKTGILFHDPDDQLFCPTVFEDIAFGPLNLGLPEEEIRKRIKESLGQVDLNGFEERSAHHLSYGEKKRIALASLFAMKPEILALDEPTSNLDPKTRKNLISILKNFEGTLIIAAHDLEAILELCERTILLSKGEIIKDGKTYDILSDEKLMNESNLEIPLTIKLSR